MTPVLNGRHDTSLGRRAGAPSSTSRSPEPAVPRMNQEVRLVEQPGVEEAVRLRGAIMGRMALPGPCAEGSS
jgi:hypothetical protein